MSTLAKENKDLDIPTEEGRQPDGSPLYDDVDVGFIVVLGVISAIVTFVSIMAVQGLFFHLKDAQIRQKEYGTPVAAAEQITKQRESLNGYLEADDGVYEKSIPIDRAMALTLDDFGGKQEHGHADDSHADHKGEEGHDDADHDDADHDDASQKKKDADKKDDAE